MRPFKNHDGQYVDLIKHTMETLAQNRDTKVYVGSDSQNRGELTRYAVTVAFRYGTRGTHFIYHRFVIKRITDRWRRLWKEVELSVEIAKLLEENSIKVHCVDLDFNKREMARSHEMVAAAKGYVMGSGFSCSIKPEEQVASRAADHIIRG
jgi:predicted RNase H-related nuclease YkuK (DUF458 family)